MPSDLPNADMPSPIDDTIEHQLSLIMRKCTAEVDMLKYVYQHSDRWKALLIGFIFGVFIQFSVVLSAATSDTIGTVYLIGCFIVVMKKKNSWKHTLIVCGCMLLLAVILVNVFPITGTSNRLWGATWLIIIHVYMLLEYWGAYNTYIDNVANAIRKMTNAVVML